MDVIEIILEERNKTHGDWSNTACGSSAMFNVFIEVMIKTGKKPLPPEMEEAIRMALLKIARIASGNAFNVEHWDDAIGYLTLGRNYVRPAKTELENK